MYANLESVTRDNIHNHLELLNLYYKTFLINIVDGYAFRRHNVLSANSCHS